MVDWGELGQKGECATVNRRKNRGVFGLLRIGISTNEKFQTFKSNITSF
jgi:hypothetical protein